MNDTSCPFHPGEWAVYRPSTQAKEAGTGYWQLKPGARYRVVGVIANAFLVLEGLEEAVPGGLHWKDFRKAPPR